MSSITFQCQSCEADFEVDIEHLLERPNAIKCSNCGAKPSASRNRAFAQSLEELLSAMAALRSKVAFELNLNTEELPPPFGGSDDDADAGLGGGDDDLGDDDVAFDDDDDDDDDDDFDDDYDEDSLDDDADDRF
ncbi:MAG: hypothetical protein AAFN74_18585 [Myxococcota bacterium]